MRALRRSEGLASGGPGRCGEGQPVRRVTCRARPPGRTRVWPLRRSLFAALDAGCSVSVWWRSGRTRSPARRGSCGAGRTQPSRSSSGMAGRPRSRRRSQFDRERGSIDILATRRSDGVALVVEVKSGSMSVEELLRTLDRKVRLAPRSSLSVRAGARAVVGRLVVFADRQHESAARRRASTCSRRRFRCAVTMIAAWLRGHAAARSGLALPVT